MKPTVSLTFDDGLPCQIDCALSILNRRGLRGTFFLPVESKTYPLITLPWQRAADKGHEIGSHTMRHRKAAEYRHSRQDLNYEIGKSKTELERIFSTTVTSFCYPFTDAFPELQETVRLCQYSQARGGRGATATASKLFNNGNFLNVPCYHVGPYTVGQATTWAEEVEDARGWLTLMFHGVGGTSADWDNISSEQFEHLLDAFEHVEVKTFADGAAEARKG